MPDESVHACVTDPPYGLAFMGKKWDYDVPTEDVWREVLRVLKPGGFLLSFSGTRTYHRMVVRIEDAGFEIRDMIQWLYGSGFPKSHNVSKAIDKEAGAERSEGERKWSGGRTSGPSSTNIATTFREKTSANPQTEDAKKWDGWGSALKPANEPICVARKPLIGTIAQNVLAHGCGGLNIDGCRIGLNGESQPRGSGNPAVSTAAYGDFAGIESSVTPLGGRWPANVVHDGSDEVMALFPNTSSGIGGQPQTSQRTGNSGLVGLSSSGVKIGHADNRSAARFFYCAKADQAERDRGVSGVEKRQRDEGRKEGNPGGDNPRNRGLQLRGNHHPTVKPVDLMRWLVRLVCPPGGVVLDPFMGSGTTGVACRLEGFGFIGIDREPEYVELARQRIDAETPSLFAGAPE